MPGSIDFATSPRLGPSIRRADVGAQRRALYLLGVERYRDIALLMAADGEMPQSRWAELPEFAHGWTPSVFPLTGRDMAVLGIQPGERVARLLAAVHDPVEASDFTVDRAASLAYLKEFAIVAPPA